MSDNLSIAVHAFMKHMLTSLSVDEILLLSYVDWYTNFRSLPTKMEMARASAFVRNIFKKSQGNTTVHRFLQGI